MKYKREVLQRRKSIEIGIKIGNRYWKAKSKIRNIIAEQLYIRESL